MEEGEGDGWMNGWRIEWRQRATDDDYDDCWLGGKTAMDVHKMSKKPADRFRDLIPTGSGSQDGPKTCLYSIYGDGM